MRIIMHACRSNTAVTFAATAVDYIISNTLLHSTDKADNCDDSEIIRLRMLYLCLVFCLQDII
jgi:hypothetical protein